MAANKLLGVVHLTESDYYLKQLTYNRPVASIPFLGRYRLIDFTLSNLMNAGVDTVGIFLNDKYRSLMDHISSGKEWDLDRKKGGIFYFSPYSTPENLTQMRGDIYNYFANIDYFTEGSGEYAAILGTAMVMNIELSDVLKEHIDSKADVTMVYKTMDAKDSGFEKCNTVILNEYGGVSAVGKNIKKTDATEKKKRISLETYIVKKELLVDMITDAIATGENAYLTDMLHDAVKKYKVRGYEYKGFVKHIGSVENYFEASMSMLKEDALRDVFFGENTIKTKTKDETPTFYSESSNVVNSLVANGCEIEGTVINSIIFRRVKVAKGAVVKDSIIMQNGEVRENCNLEYVITDKQVVLTEGTELKGSEKNPVVVNKGAVI